MKKNCGNRERSTLLKVTLLGNAGAKIKCLASSDTSSIALKAGTGGTVRCHLSKRVRFYIALETIFANMAAYS